MKNTKLQKIFLFSIIFLSGFFVSQINPAQAYNPPIGIPDPGMWGTTHPIDGVAPDTATKCPAWPNGQTDNCYYIDNTHPQATDTNNSYGYPDKPRMTIPGTGTSPAFTYTYSEGSYIEIHGGPYTENIYVKVQGTSDHIIWFRGTQGAKPNLQGKIVLADTSKFTIFENMDFSNSPTGAIFTINTLSSNNICLRNSTIHDIAYPGYATSCVSSNPQQGGNINNLVFYNLEFIRIGDQFTTTDDDIHCLVFGLWGKKPPTTLRNVWVLDCKGDQLGGSFHQFNGDMRDANVAALEGRTETNLDNIHHLYCGRNVVSNARQSLGAPKFSTDVIYSQNVAHDNYSMNTGVGTGMSYQEGSRRVWFIFNKVYNEMFAIRSSNVSFDPAYREAIDLRSYMIGNVIYNVYNGPNAFYYNRDDIYKPAQAFKHEQGYYQRWMIDNTIYNVGGGITSRNAIGTDDTTYIFGNVVAGVNGVDDNNNPDYHLTLFDGTNHYDYNYFQPHSVSGNFSVRDTGATPLQRMYSLTNVQSSTGECTHCEVGNPLFINAASGDLRPAPGSPLIGKNVRNQVYDLFYSLYGIDIAYDFDGKHRPTSEPWTLGAFEASEYVPDTTAPSSPTNLSVL
jgi:hypothetical protein